EVTEEREMRRRTVVVERHRLLGELAPAHEVLLPLVARHGAPTQLALGATFAGEGDGRSLGGVAHSCKRTAREQNGPRWPEVVNLHHTRNGTLPTCSRDVNHARTASVSQAPDAPLVEAEKMSDFMDDGLPDLLPKRRLRGAVPQQWPGEDRDPVGEAGEVVWPLRQGNALVEAIEGFARRVEPERQEQGRSRLVLDHDGDVRQVAGELLRDAGEGLRPQPF